MLFNPQNRVTGHIASLFAALFFALNVPATTYLLDGWVAPTGYALVRIVGGVVICWVASLFVHDTQIKKRRDYISLFLAGVLGMGLFFMFYGVGIGNTSPIDASIILTISPVMVLVVSAIIYRERLTARKGVGIAIAMGGAILVVVLQGKGEEASGWVGNLLILATATVYGSYLLFTRNLSKRYNPVAMLRWIFLFALIVYLPFCLTPLLHSKVVTAPELTPVLVTLFVAIFPSALSFLLLPLAMQSLPTTVVSMYNYSIPIIATAVSIALGQDTLHWIDPVSTLLVIIGVYFVTVQRKTKQGVKEK